MIAPPPPEWFMLHPWLREAGVAITPETAIQVSAVYGCCRLIVDSLAPAPIRVYEVESRGRREIRYDDDAAYTLNWGAPARLAPDALPGQAIEEALYWNALTDDGNGYAEIQFDGAGRFFALWPIESSRVTPRHDEDGLLYYEIQQPMGGTARIDPSRMFHLRGPSLRGWLGNSIVTNAAKAIGIAQASQIFAGAYLANGTVLSGYFKSAKLVSDDQKSRYGKKWRQNFAGSDKAGGTPFLDQGVEYVGLNHDAQKSQLVETRRFQVAEIARFFGVPLTLLAENEAWTNLSELYLGFRQATLLPWASRFDSEATRKLFPQRQPWREVEHDLTSLVVGTEAFKRTAESLNVLVRGGIKSRNEARAILGENSVPDGDELVIDGNVKTLEDVLDPPEPPEPAPATPAMEPAEPAEPRRQLNGRSNIARAAVALDRFANRLKAEKHRLHRRPADEAATRLAAERRKLVPALIDECERAAGDTGPDFDMRVLALADAVLNGEPAHEAAEKLLK
jgi:HK97 family phage portal protein